jgi:nitrite reductase/ring-hydroxylating ferredoxin subunit
MASELCRLDEIPEDNGIERRHLSSDGTLELAIFMTGGAVHAYRNACPHLGRSLSFAPGEFLLGKDGELICPHHGACFDLVSGACLSGPCQGSALQAVAVRVENGRVLLDQR